MTTRTATILRALAVVAVATLGLSACATPAPAPTPTRTAPVAEPLGDGVLRIGTLLPATGSAAYIGPAQAAGVALAVADINAAGGVDGTPVEVIARDSGDASASTLEASFAELVAAGADVIIGPSSSLLAERAIPLAAQARVPLISPAATFPGLTSADDDGYFFRTIAAYGHQGLAVGEVLSADGPVDVAFVYIDDEFGKALAPVLAQGVEGSGSTLVLSLAIPVGTSDLTTAIGNLTDSQPDVVVIGSTYATFDATRALIAAVIAAGYTGAEVLLTTQNTGDYSQALPNGTLKDVRGLIEGAQPDDAFLARLKGVDGSLGPTRYALEAYDAAILAALAATSAADDAGEAIALTLESVSRGGIKCATYAECLEVLSTQPDIDYDGLSGPLNLTPDGDVSPASYGIYSYDGENRFVFGRGVLAG